MHFAADNSAVRILTIWISVSGIAATSLLSAIAGLVTPWFLLLSGISGLLTVFLALWYPRRYADTMRGSFDGKAIRAVTGVFTKKNIYVPIGALRTFETVTTPLQRLYGCRTVILRFAGGSAILPLLPTEQAQRLTAALEQYGE